MKGLLKAGKPFLTFTNESVEGIRGKEGLMKRQEGIHFAPQWIEYLNNDPELKERISKGGATPSLDGKDLLALNLKGLSKPCVVSLKDGTFSFEQRKAKDPKMTVRLPVEEFLRLVHPDARPVWNLMGVMGEDAKLEVADDISWPEVVTIFELMVCLAELADKNPELTAA